jgi:hypothetical protein
MALNRQTAHAQLREAAEVLAARLESAGAVLVTMTGRAPERIDHALTRTASTYALMLFSTDEMSRRIAADVITQSFIDPAQLADPTWWTCDLARALAREIGHVDHHVTRTTARHILHVSRQAVDQMVSRGDLDAVTGQSQPAVTRESVARAARRRYPYTSDTSQPA